MSESPLSRAEGAKHRRDLPDEISILTSANADLEAQPWYPLQPGDVVLVALSGGPEFFGETYVGRNDSFETVLECVSATEVVQSVEVLFHDLWFEAGRDVLTVIRAGRVVFGTPQQMDGA